MKKRGQITLFIIVGLVLILGVIIFFLMRDSASGMDARAAQIKDEDAKEVYFFIKDCQRDAGQEALFYFGYEGGRTEFFPHKYDYSDYSVPYYFYEGVSYMPDENELDRMILSKYMDDNLLKCINNFEGFPGLRVIYENPQTSTKIASKSVVFDTDFEVTVYKGEKEIQVGPDFRFEYQVRLGEILTITKTIIENQLTNELFIHWDYITDKTNDGFQITAYTEKDNTIVYRIIDEKNELYDADYLFQFANKYYIKES